MAMASSSSARHLTDLLPLVGCVCGKLGGLVRIDEGQNRHKYSFCKHCKHYQCLQCGEDFPSNLEIQLHLTERDHVDGTASVTTDYRNSPEYLSSGTRKHSGDIHHLHCGNCYVGHPNNTYKLSEYMSKCWRCQTYICLICGKTKPIRKDLEYHITTPNLDGHNTGLQAPVSSELIAMNSDIAQMYCATCKQNGSARKCTSAEVGIYFACKYCGLMI